MAVSLTIKNVPDKVAAALRARAAANRRSLQGELLALVEAVAGQRDVAPTPFPAVSEPQAGYRVRKPVRRPAKGAPRAVASGERLTIEQLWLRAQRLGPSESSESAAIIRALRDARNGR